MLRIAENRTTVYNYGPVYVFFFGIFYVRKYDHLNSSSLPDRLTKRLPTLCLNVQT